MARADRGAGSRRRAPFSPEALDEASAAVADPSEPLGPRAARPGAARRRSTPCRSRRKSADYAYKAAGTDGIFIGSARWSAASAIFHTVSQQIQARLANFEPIGQVPLGGEPVEPIL